MNEKEMKVVTPSNPLFDPFDDSFEEEFQQKILNGEINSDEEAVAYLKKEFKKNHPEMDI